MTNGVNEWGQQMGVLTGQFIRAQRLCSTLNKFKTAVQNVTLAAMRRGYKRRELDRMWGKFLMDWWKAEEMRRAELRAWFRKMTQFVSNMVRREFRGLQEVVDHFNDGGQFAEQKAIFTHGSKCWWREFAFRFPTTQTN